MIQPLRRVHRRAFIVLAIALPLILFAALAGRAKKVSPPHSTKHMEKLP